MEVGVNGDGGSSNFGHGLDLLEVLSVLDLLGGRVCDGTARRNGSSGQTSQSVAEEESESKLGNHCCGDELRRDR